MLTSIRSRVLAVAGAIVAVLLGVLALGLLERRHTTAQLALLTGEVAPTLARVTELSSGLAAVRAATFAASLTERESGLGLARQRHDAAAADLDRARLALSLLPVEQHAALGWAELDGRLSAFHAADELTWAALAAGDPARAREALLAGEAPTREALTTLTALARRELGQTDAVPAAQAGARDTTNLGALAALALALALVIALGAMLTRALQAPITTLKAAADSLARGELEAPLDAPGGDEFDALRASVRRAFDGLRDLVRAAEAVADGDSTVQVTPRGPRDLLAQSINSVARTLAEAAHQADLVAAGDYEGRISPRSSKDRLGLAVQRMTQTLADLGRAAERLAKGDLEVEITSQSDGDRVALAINRLVVTLKNVSQQANVIAAGDYAADIAARGEKDELGLALRKMTGALRDAAAAARDADWLKSGVAAMNEVVLGEDDVQTIATAALSAMARHLDATAGALYVFDESDRALRLVGTWAWAERKHLANRFLVGEGLIGQAALERRRIVLQTVPDDYVRVVSGLGEAPPRSVVVAPVLFKGELRAVVELATLEPVGAGALQYLDQVSAVLGVALEIARTQGTLRKQQEELRASNDELVSQTRALEQAGQELKAQQAELEQTNAELETQMLRVQDSESRLRTQQRELATTNTELESRNAVLEQQKAEIEKARRAVTAQAEALAVASKYKSEFLANMSHELRTPLNSLLLLARALRDDPAGNLTDSQRESASVIFASGNDLLNLINEILDLSKIEAGRMDLRLETVDLPELAQVITRQFEPMARAQGLALAVHLDDAPASITTDPGRLGQVLKNLMGNAMKFTEVGSVTLSFGPARPDERLARPVSGPVLAIRVTDTGIGIPLDKQRIVFEAFQQADSGDRRRYGGTGLGLSISRELVTLLGGELHLVSQPGVGSTFTVLLPVDATPTTAVKHAAAAPVPSALAPPPLADDRDGVDDGDRVMLIIEDDARFLATLVGEVRRRGFKCLAAGSGGEGLALARSYRPGGVILDLNLPDTNGWSVLSALKQDVDTRHIPVHIVSGEEASLEGLRIGAIGHAHKPLRTEDIDAILSTIARSSATAEKLVLVVEDDPVMRRETVRIIGNGTVHVQEATSGTEALAALEQRRFDLVVLDLGLPDMQGLELLRVASQRKLFIPPVIVYTVRELTSAEELALRDYADSIIIKDVRSQERLLDEVALFLHRVVGDLPAEKQRAIRHLYESDERLRGKRVLVVEDDMRTMFAMTRLLASHGIDPLKAANGADALALLEQHPDVDLVLLDMMMPVMDGYEAARRIRRAPAHAHLPIIALTAKAMKEDRQRCIEAGASDYLTKPVEQDRLLSLMRVWLSR